MRSRLFLKKIITSDIDERVMSWFDDKDLMKYYTSSKNKISKENLLLSIKESEINHVHTFGIFFKENDEIIGTIKIGPIHQVHKTSDLVALIGDKNYLGKGLSVEAIKLGNEIAFSDFDVRRLQGGMYISNLPSIKAYTRAGWMVDGLHKGFYYLNGVNEDRLTVCCLNPRYFTEEDINSIKNNESRYVY